MTLETTSRFWKGILLIWISHLLLDFMLGVWPVYKTLANLDLLIAGLIASVGICLGEGLQLYFGFLSDKGYHQKLLTIGLGLTATIPFLSYVEKEWVLFIMILCAYIGSGAFHPSASGLVLGGGEHKSYLIAFFACGGMVGAALSQIIYTFIYYRFEGQTWFLVLPILMCVFICLIFTFSKVSLSPDEQKFQFRKILQDLAPYKFKLNLLYIIHVSLQLIVLSFTFLLPDILKLKGYEEWVCLGGGYFCFIFGAVLTSVPIGYCIDKIGFRLVLTTIVIISAILLYLFLSIQTLSIVPQLCLLALLGGSMGVIVPVVVAGGTQEVPVHTRSFVSSLYMGGTTCIAGFGPVLVSLIASFFDNNAPIIALQGLSSLFIISLIFIYYLPDSVDSEELQLIKN